VDALTKVGNEREYVMLVTTKNPIAPSAQHQNGFYFPCTMMRTEHIQNTTDRRVYLLDGYGFLHTIAKTAVELTASAVVGLSITTGIFHDTVSNTAQIEDKAYTRSPEDFREASRVSGGLPGCSLVVSQTVAFTLDELSANDVIHDRNSNYFVSLSKDALVAVSESRSNPSPQKTVSTDSSSCTLALNMVIVDNRTNAPSSYYVNVLGRVYEVPVTVDNEIEDGVWIQSNREQAGPNVAEWQSLTDSVYAENRDVVPPVTLFTNALEAKRFGNESNLIKEQERIHASELARIKQDFEKTKAENLRQKEELEMRSNGRKDYYEERSSRRKDDNEKIGIVAKVITGVVAVAGALVGLIRWFT